MGNSLLLGFKFQKKNVLRMFAYVSCPLLFTGTFIEQHNVSSGTAHAVFLSGCSWEGLPATLQIAVASLGLCVVSPPTIMLAAFVGVKYS